jgi:diguanylate cyclase (GGDEF)-like protein
VSRSVVLNNVVVNSSRFEVLETSREATLVVDKHGILHYLSVRAEGLLECEPGEATGASLWSIAASWQELLETELSNILNGNKGSILELHHEETGHYFKLTPVAHGDFVVIYLEQLKDGTASRGIREQVHGKFKEQVREQLGTVETVRRGRQQDALHDSLTGFANRFGLLDTLNHHALHDGTQNNGTLHTPTLNNGSQWHHGTFLVLDIDRFQILNDSLGYQVGDDLLVAFSQRLLHALRPNDFTARLGSDEFAVLLPTTDEREAFSVAERLQKSLEHPFILHGTELAVSVSIGILGNLSNYDNTDDMLRDADLSLHHAKRLGVGKLSVFDPALREELLARVALEIALKNAIDNHELEVYYQPIFDLRSNALVGLETLSRWHRPEGSVSPTTFIPIAEETGFILEIDKWVLESACQQITDWQALGLTTAPLNINVSGSHFAQAGMARHFQNVLQSHHMSPTQIHLELTETVLMDEGQQTQQTLQDLQQLGVQLHIDDFGTGYASLSYLQRFSAHGLKIDRSFIAALHDHKSYELIRAMIAMAHALNMKVVAEGIETPWQRQKLEELGCDYGQGYLLSRPLPAKHIEPLLGFARPRHKGPESHQALS